MMEEGPHRLVREFIKGRSRAFGGAFETFIRERNLDFDDQYWSEQDQADYSARISPLVAEWETKQAELLATLRAEFPNSGH